MKRTTLLSQASILILTILATPLTWGEGQTQIRNYDKARPLFWREIYAKHGGETLYCAEPLQKGYNQGVNIEHVFPMSWATNGLKCGTRKQCRKNSEKFNHIEADLHNMYPALTEINDARGSLAFGIIPGEERRYGQCDFEISTNGKRLVEPRDAVLGEIARAAMYMAYTYDELYLTKEQQTLMQLWHEMDPPSDHEKWRNDLIEDIQGTRNPFIDDPAFSKKAY